MRNLLVYLTLFFSFECLCQLKISNVEIDYDDVFELKGLVYFKSDQSLVTGKVIRYNNKNVAQRYIIVENGKPDNLGWKIISDKVEEPKESLLGSAIVAAAMITGLTSTVAGNDIIPPMNGQTIDYTNQNYYTTKSYLNAQKEYTSKSYHDMENRNYIIETLFKVKEKINDSLVLQKGKESMILSEDPIDVNKEGPWKEFFDTGELKITGSYKNGLKEGIWEEYYENGQLKEKVIFINGVKDGLWLKYYSNNQLWGKGQYENGKMIGEWKYYDEDGNELFTEFYAN